MADLRWVRLESAVLSGLRFEVKALYGEDELNRLFWFSVEIAILGPTLTDDLLCALLRSPATLAIEESGSELSRIHGLVADVRHIMSTTDDGAIYSVTLVPRAWALTRTRRSEIFLDRSVPQILAERLSGIDLEEGADFRFVMREKYPSRELVAQYDESDFHFICRLCEDLGIVFFFDHRDGRDVLVMTDTREDFEPIARPRPELRVGEPSDDRVAFELARTLRRVPGEALVHDHNHRAPRLDLLAAKTIRNDASCGAWIEYGVHAKTPEEAAHVARVRAEELGAMQEVFTGKSTEMVLRVGATVVLIDAAGEPRELLLTRVVLRSHLPGEDAIRGERTWHNEFTAIPKEVTYRPPRMTAKPRVPGLVHAVVDGAIRGPYAELDEAGRYRVRFGYDLSGRTDLQASRPVRMLQPHAGAGYGLHLPLRPGTEVMIAFVEGDPDRPVIAGAIPNAETPSPVEQANQTQNVLRTASFNEIVMEDLAGQERIRAHTPHARTTLQLGAQEEPEEGALLSTDASITEASGRSINEVTCRSVLLCATSSALAGESAVVLAGVDGLLPAVEAGMQRIGSVMRQGDAIDASLERIAEAPGEGYDAEGEDGGEADAPASIAPRHERGAGGGRWSDLTADLAARARNAAVRAISAMARAVGAHLRKSLGRLQGEPQAKPEGPSAILGGAGTAALFGRDSALVFGDRAASLASEDTASVAGGRLSQLKSPGSVEIAGGTEAKLTSAGVADVEARVVRIAGGYFPDEETPPLGETTSVGVMARGEIEVVSGEDCVLVCAEKDVRITAHEGSMELKAEQRAAIDAGSVSVRGGSIGMSSGDDVDVRAGGDISMDAKGDVGVKAAGTITVEGAAVEIVGGTIVLKGPVKIAGDLSVAGTINGKSL